MRLGLGLRLSDILRAGAAPKSTLVDDLVSYWPLGEASGQRNDVVGTAHLSDTNTVGADTGKNGTGASFVFGNSEKLSASVDLPTQMTLQAWVAWTADSGYAPIFATDTRSFEVYGGNSGNDIAFGALGDAENVTTLSLLLPAGSWKHVLFTFDGTDLLFYHNNILVGTNASFTLNANATLEIGGTSYGYMTGLMDEVALWSRVLTEDERTELYNGGDGKFYNATTENFE